MDWLNQIGSVLGQYGGGNANQVPQNQNVDNDFDHVAQHAPPGALSNGLAAAFRSDQTPPFGQMAGQLFGQSNPQQRAGMLNTLIGAVGPSVAAQFLNRGGASGIGGLLGGGQQQVTPEQAAQVPPEAVQQMATQAEQHDPSIIDRLSDFYSQQPTLVKTLGTAALTIALAKLAQSQTNR